ncbi:MAG TPA: hypothetical protein VFT27_09900 [Actinomycetota bacterium]|nr:hypothetical protein [Actinomycetota bacterium]
MRGGAAGRKMILEAPVEVAAYVDALDGRVVFFEPRTRVVFGKIYPVGGSRRARGVDVQGDRAMITTDDGRRELWSLADHSYSYVRDID